MNATAKIFLFFLFSFFLFSASAQQINIDQLSDQQLKQYMDQASLSGLSDAELEAQAKAKGLSAEQIQKLKVRASALNSASKGTNNDITESRAVTSAKKIGSETNANPDEIKVFGADLFSRENLTFEPNLQIPTPRNYLIGVGDQLNIDLFGFSDVNYILKVSPEGTIRIPNSGPLKVVGLSFDDAQLKIKSQLTKIYPQIASGKTSVQVSVGQMRTIKVTLIGEIVKPGSYSLPSLATIANALYVSGGPNSIGSYRNIELVRNGKTISRFDLYDFLLKGDLTNNRRLEDDDIIKVNPYDVRVTISGAVKRKAIYEIHPNERLNDLLTLAGGYTDDAYKAFVRVVRFGKNEKEIVTVTAAEMLNFVLQSGDYCIVDIVANKFNNRIMVAGAVFHPGNYSLKDFSNLQSLIKVANLKEEAYLKRGLIIRRGDNYVLKQLDFNVADIVNGNNSITLQNEDSVRIFSIFDIKPKDSVAVNGEVHNPGYFIYTDSMQLQDLILQAGGFNEGASGKKIEIARRIRDSAGAEAESDCYAIVKVIELNKELEERKEAPAFLLQPFDIVSVRKNPAYMEQLTVSVEGHVLYPGDYTIQKKHERLSDIIQRAGGFMSDAYPKGSILIRSKNEMAKRVQEMTRINLLGSSDSTSKLNSDSLINKLNIYTSSIGINLLEAVNHPGSIYDIFVEDGDELSIPKEQQTIKTWGGVYLPKQIVFGQDTHFMQYINQSGGFSADAYRSKSYVIYANGSVARTRHFLFFRHYPRVEQGAEVFVPLRKANNNKLANLASVAALVTGLTTALFTLIYVSKL